MEDPIEVPRRMMEDWGPQLVDDLPEVFSGKINRDLAYLVCSYYTLCATPSILKSLIFGHWEG